MNTTIHNEPVHIGCNWIQKPRWQKVLAVPLIYIPILISVPFIVFAATVVRLHLRVTGAQNLKKYTDFLPAWVSHRYVYATQVTDAKWCVTRAFWKVFWLFNCKLYCPLSVALVKYLAYLIQIVEMWWCPFNHDKKGTYTGSEIDQSFWHVYPETKELLHPEDKRNPMWNVDESNKKQNETV